MISLGAVCAVAGIGEFLLQLQKCHLLSVSVMKIIQILSTVRNSANDISKHGQFAADIDWPLIYIFLTLATNLVCTLLIIHRILRHAPGMSATYKIVEMLIESAAMYSLSLIIYFALVFRNLDSAYYADVIATYVKVRWPRIWFRSTI